MIMYQQEAFQLLCKQMKIPKPHKSFLKSNLVVLFYFLTFFFFSLFFLSQHKSSPSNVIHPMYYYCLSDYLYSLTNEISFHAFTASLLQIKLYVLQILESRVECCNKGIWYVYICINVYATDLRRRWIQMRGLVKQTQD